MILRHLFLYSLFFSLSIIMTGCFSNEDKTPTASSLDTIIGSTPIDTSSPPSNAPPTLSNVRIIDFPGNNATLNGAYIYSDLEGNPEGVSLYQWYKDGAIIDGATSKTYTLVGDDFSSNIAFNVTPVALSGSTPGISVKSTLSSTPPLDLILPQ
jgi:hypothetical protein